MKGSDNELLAALVRGDEAKPVADPYGCITAALISKPVLFLISVDRAGTARASVDMRKSRSFELADRSAGALRSLHTSISRFVASAHIDHVFMRISSDGGDYAPHPWHSKIEAALQLVESLKVSFVNTQSIRAWAGREALDLPAFQPLLPGARWRDPQVRCLETALFAVAKGSEARCFSDGSLRHG